MNLDYYKKAFKHFVIILGYIDVLNQFDSFSDIMQEYKEIQVELLQWIEYYYTHKNFDIITYEKSFEIHQLLDDIKEKKLFDKKIGNESILTDEILICYEAAIKMININKEAFKKDYRGT